MIIIVEGIDRVGKSTLCNLLSKELGIDVFKNTSFYGKCLGKKSEIELINQLINFVECTKQNIIFDRLHLSEFVYGMLDRGYVNTDIMKVDDRLSKMDCILIYVKPTSVTESSKQHGSDLYFHEVAFDAFMKKTKIPSIICNYNTLQQTVDRVKQIVYNVTVK